MLLHPNHKLLPRSTDILIPTLIPVLPVRRVPVLRHSTRLPPCPGLIERQPLVLETVQAGQGFVALGEDADDVAEGEKRRVAGRFGVLEDYVGWVGVWSGGWCVGVGH